MQKNIHLHEIKDNLDDIINETIDFIRSLKQQKKFKHMETALTSESAFKKDWLKQEEDEAWQNLYRHYCCSPFSFSYLNKY